MPLSNFSNKPSLSHQVVPPALFVSVFHHGLQQAYEATDPLLHSNNGSVLQASKLGRSVFRDRPTSSVSLLDPYLR